MHLKELKKKDVFKVILTSAYLKLLGVPEKLASQFTRSFSSIFSLLIKFVSKINRVRLRRRLKYLLHHIVDASIF